MNARARASRSIAQAKVELDVAIAEIDSIQVFDPAVIALVAHALSNYISVTGATIEMLQQRLHDHDDSDVGLWLEGIRHAADLMQHSVGRLVSLTAPRDFPLKRDYVNLPVLMERACHFYRARADAEHVHITCGVIGHVPLAWADRVALAVIAENLLASAVRVSPPHTTIRVRIVPEAGYVLCSIRDAGPSLSAEECDQLFAPPALVASDPAPSRQGLAVAREFARRMNGDLWCDPDPGPGAGVSFRVPAVE
jgi:signal transduction histidine kinase